jgi:hypothetical protein
MAETKGKTKSNPKPKKKPAPTLHDIKRVIYPALGEAGRKVAGATNDVKTVVQEAAGEIHQASEDWSKKRINDDDYKAIVESWAQAEKSAEARASSSIGNGTVNAMKSMAGAAIKLLFGW